MFLKSLTITKNGKVIREIPFRNGINLIVDETVSVKGTETGNNVGKTTVLILIDYCLGASAKHIYTDPEDKKQVYKLVKDFLVENNVFVTLVLKEDLAREDSPEICIERNFLARSQKVQKINGVAKTAAEFDEALTDILFPGHYGKKPTIRQIISHNIRYKDLSLNNTTRTLDSFTSDAEYETLYLFLLGCDFDQGDIKQELLTQIHVENTFKKRLEDRQTKSAYETALGIIEDEIKELNQRKSNFNLNKNFETDLDLLNQVRYQISLTSSEIGKLNIRKELINEAKSELEQSSTKIDQRQLEQIYKQATDQVEGIQKTFEELCSFHNQMISEKVKYLAKDLPKLENMLGVKSETLNLLLGEEAAFAERLSHSDSFEELEKLSLELNEKYRKKGEYDNILHQLGEVEEELKSLGARLDAIDNELFSEEFELKIKEQVKKFNKHFSTISQELYNEQYALKADPTVIKQGKNKGRKVYRFSSFNTNFSTGKKQGEISCFDIAYTLFADDENIPCFHFLLNDKKELMHNNQLLKIAKLVNNKGIQYVASILKDKLPEPLNREDYFVVKLSQEEKLFRIEAL